MSKRRYSKNPVPDRLREARERAGYSQRALGIAARFDPSVASPRINQYETGRHVPSLAAIARLAEVLGLPMAYFFAEDPGLAEMIRAYAGLSPKQRKQAAEVVAALGTRSR